MRLHRLSSTTVGVPVVLLHALPLDHRMWKDVADQLPGPVLAVDIPDRTTPGAPSLDAMAGGLAEALRDQVGPAVVVGSSMGGYLALALLAHDPGLVAGLGLVGTRAGADAPEARERRLAMVDEIERTSSVLPVLGMLDGLLGATTRRSRPQVVAAVGAWAREQPPEAIAWCQRAIAGRADRTAALAAFEGPVLVLAGDEDGLTGGQVALDTAACSAASALVVLPGAGHLAPVERPTEVASAIAGLAASVGSRS